ncbi:MAG TPA: glycosyl hydrolase [Terracidiphilus sp.]|nr:glycosyl hydrolase [Terracidiphilus sp.]
MRINRFACALAGCLIFASTLVFAAPPQPVNPDASPEARALLAYIDSISGKAIVSGEHNYPNDGSRWTDRAYDLTGKYPGLFGEDFGFSAGDDKDSVLSRPATVQEIKRQWQHGSIIALTWHAVRPTDDEPVTFHDSVQGKLTDYEWHQLLTPGTPLYKRWCAQVDVIAGYLRQLRDAHVPVLFRAYHEMNGNWFWWGGRPGQDGSTALYRQIYNRFVHVHHLNNIVWVWNVNAPSANAGSIASYYPGPQYVDVVTMDIYGEFKPEYYRDMLALAAGKPIALAEVGALPTPQVLAAQPRWAYFMDWTNLFEFSNSLDEINAVYNDPRVLNRADPRLAAPMAGIRKATLERDGSQPTASPVTDDPIPAASALLNRLMAAPGTGVLSGFLQPPAPAANAASLPAQSIAQSTGRNPALFAAELPSATPSASTTGASAAAARADLLQTLRAAHARHQEIGLVWQPARPTDLAPAAAHGQLTDYEWHDLLTPGTLLNQRWNAQVDGVAQTLRALQKENIAVLFNPLPDANGKDFWWAGRKGITGSSQLYRQLFDRLVHHDGLRNLLFVWQSGPPRFVPGGGTMADFFPGLLYVDALQVHVHALNARFPIDRFFAQFAVGKPLGVRIDTSLPAPDAFAPGSDWAWFIHSPQPDAPVLAGAWKALLDSPRVVSVAAAP